MKHLIIDGNAQSYRYFFSNINEDVDTITATAILKLMAKGQALKDRYKPDDVIIAFDCKNDSWRKVYTSDKNKDKVTHRLYKDGRNRSLSESKKQKLKEFTDNFSDFVEFFKTQTNILCLQADYLEADDLIAGYVQAHPEDDHIIFSSDKDFMQLINSVGGKVTLVEPVKFEERSLDEWNNDPELFLFEKFFRGEGFGKDNIQSAYPRLRKTEIFKAYEDDYHFNNLMEHTFVVEEVGEHEPIEHNYVTRDLFEENKLLIDLKRQPKYIRNIIDKTIKESNENRGSFYLFDFIAFTKRFGMSQILVDKEQYFDFISSRYLTSGSG
jgi:hypothetical protein